MKIHIPEEEMTSITRTAGMLGLTRQEAATLILCYGIQTFPGPKGALLLDAAGRRRLRLVAEPILRSRKGGRSLVPA
jgi:hypothetical protein